MDAYYAALEIREQPQLKGECVIVGGSPNSRGVVSTCSYEARKFGVHSGMPSSVAWRLCPQAIFIYPTFGLYKEVSAQIREIFYRYTDLVEPVSLDEAYLDVTEPKVQADSASAIAMMIKHDILQQTKLTCSAGVSYNKFLAKIGSEINKPDGFAVIPPQKAMEVLFALPIEKFHGIGKVTAARMKKLGIHNGKDLHNMELKDLLRHFGKTGLFFYYVVRGIDNREVITQHIAKSISNENTFSSDIDSMDILMQELKRIADKLSSRMMYKKMEGQNLCLKLKYDNFEQITRNTNLPIATNDADVIFKWGQKLLVKSWDQSRKVRLIGLGFHRLEDERYMNCEQMVLPFMESESL